MTDKELRHLSRGELIEIIYEMKKREDALDAEKQALQQKLADRQIRMDSTGSIAEAALALNDVFAAAQSAADDYLRSVHADCADAETMSRQILEDANRQAGEIVAKARQEAESINAAARQQLAQVQAQCEDMKRKAETENRARWDAFQSRVGELFVSYRTSEGENAPQGGAAPEAKE